MLDVLERCTGMEPDERATFLDAECDGDGVLRALVEKALGYEQDSLLRPAAMEGRQVGSWRIEREFGSGGMGAVYLAVRAGGELRQCAALKLVKPGMDTRDVLRRFVNGRQVLADLEHPGISRVREPHPGHRRGGLQRGRARSLGIVRFS